MAERPSSKDLAILDDLVASLRAPNGCPWDREQTLSDLRPYLLEEAHELAAALDRQDWDGFCDEMGDLLFQVAFLGHLNEEAGRSGVEDAIRRVHRKMVERHPHVFGNEVAADPKEVAAAWERRKIAFRDSQESLLDGVSDSLPSLVAAYRMTQKASGVGFDWTAPEQVVQKIREELAEVEQARAGEGGPVEEELGDLLFAVANLARHLDVDPEGALARSNLKFRQRFRYIEDQLDARGGSLTHAELAEMDALWQEAKELERKE